MIIYIGNLSAATAGHDLLRLAGLPAATPVRIIKKQVRHAVMSRYGLVHARSDREGQKLVDYLNGKMIHGTKISVREFGHRLAGNERRRLDWRAVPWEGAERRMHERRVNV